MCIALVTPLLVFKKNFWMVSLSLLQVAFVFLVYPALVLSYAGQAAFISKHLVPNLVDLLPFIDTEPNEYFHLTEAVPNSK